jgi:hypothetical protein
MKSSLFRFIEGQTHISTSWDAKMSLTLIDRNKAFFNQTSTLPPNMHQELTKYGRCCMQNNQLPTKSHVELEDKFNSTLLAACKTLYAHVRKIIKMQLLPIPNVDFMLSLVSGCSNHTLSISIKACSFPVHLVNSILKIFGEFEALNIS